MHLSNISLDKHMNFINVLFLTDPRSVNAAGGTLSLACVLHTMCANQLEFYHF